MRYLLFIYGQYDEVPFVIKNLAKLLSEIASDDVKYQYGESGAIYKFNTLLTKQEIDEQVSPYLRDLSAMYFLVPFNSGVKFYIHDKNIQNHLLGDEEIVSEPDNLSVDDEKLGEILFEKEIDLNSNDMEFFGQVMEFIQWSKEDTENEFIEQPTLDELLEKITETGIESLTETEINLLHEYSKGR